VNDPITGAWEAQRAAMGAFIRSQRELANMSLRELSRATQVSNAYLSQIERGLHDPTLKVLVQIANALNVSVDDLLRESGGLDAETMAAAGTLGVEAAVAADPFLTTAEKDALLGVYRSYRAGHQADRDGGAARPGAAG
jgi:transcriptional regulator with XRE-family HTH domain